MSAQTLADFRSLAFPRVTFEPVVPSARSALPSDCQGRPHVNPASGSNPKYARTCYRLQRSHFWLCLSVALKTGIFLPKVLCHVLRLTTGRSGLVLKH